jgi:hypothetical protein
LPGYGFSLVKSQPLFTIALDEGFETLYEQLLFGSELEMLATRDIEFQLLALVAHWSTAFKLGIENTAVVQCDGSEVRIVVAREPVMWPRKMLQTSESDTRSVSVFYDFEKAEDPTTGIENGNGLTGVFNKLYRELDCLFGVREIVHDQRKPGLVSDARAVKLLPHGCGNGDASH